MSRALVVLLAALFLVGCSGIKVLDFTPAEEIKPFHPPLPAAVTPHVPQPIVVTPERATDWLQMMEDGTLDYFVIYGFHAQDWLSMAVYDKQKDRYIDQLLNILKWYGHPSLQDEPLPTKSLEPEPALPTVQAED